MLGRLDAMSLAGGVAFLAVVGIVATAALRGLGRYYGKQTPPATCSSAERAR